MSFLDLIKENTNTIFSKKECKYCMMLKDRLNELKIPYTEYEFNSEDPTYKSDTDKLKSFTSMTTFPMLYIGNKLVGGYTSFIENETEYAKEMTHNNMITLLDEF